MEDGDMEEEPVVSPYARRMAESLRDMGLTLQAVQTQDPPHPEYLVQPPWEEAPLEIIVLTSPRKPT